MNTLALAIALSFAGAHVGPTATLGQPSPVAIGMRGHSHPIGPLHADRSADGLWAISGTVNGIDANFLVDTGLDHTMMLPGPFASGQKLVQIRIDTLSMSMTIPVSEARGLREDQAQLSKTPLGAVKPFVMLGLDFLANMAIGFDYVSNEITIWPDGKFTSQSADEWVAKGADPSAHESVAMQAAGGLWFGIPVTVGERHVVLIVDSGANGGALLSKLLPTAGTVQVARVNVTSPTAMGITTYCLAPTVSSGAITVPWWSFVAVDKLDMQGFANLEGVFAMEDFRSERVLLDLQNSRVHYRKMDRAYSYRRMLLEMLKLPVTFSEDKITLGPSPNPTNRTYDGKTIISIAGVSSEDIRKALYHPDATSGAALVILASATLPPKDSFIFVVDTDKGQVRIKVASSVTPHL